MHACKNCQSPVTVERQPANDARLSLPPYLVTCPNCGQRRESKVEAPTLNGTQYV